MTFLPRTWIEDDDSLDAEALNDLEARIDTGITEVDLDTINVRRYGATGDGTTDDTVAIQNAINAATAIDVGAVWFPIPAVSYRIGTLVVPSSITLFGQGNRSILKRKAGHTGPLLDSTAGPVTDQTIRDLAIHNDNSAELVADHAAGVSHVVWERVTVTNFSSVVLRIPAGAANVKCAVRACKFIGLGPENESTVLIYDSDHLEYRDNYLEEAGALKSESNSGGVVRHLSVTGNRFKNVHATNIQIRNNGTGALEDILVAGNVSVGAGSPATPKGLADVGEHVGVGTSTVKGIVIAGNICRNHHGNAIIVGGGPSPANCEDVVVTGNVIDGRDPDTDLWNGYAQTGISVGQVTNGSVTGNLVAYTERSGIRLVNSSMDVTGNRVDFAVRGTGLTLPSEDNECGIGLFSGCYNMTISGNTVRNTGAFGGTAGSAGIGMTSDSDMHNIYIIGNRCFDDRSPQFQSYGVRVGTGGLQSTLPQGVTVAHNDLRNNLTQAVKRHDTTGRGNLSEFNRGNENTDTPESVAAWQKAGAIVDSDFYGVPGDGTLGVDSTNNRLYVRVGGAWKHVDLV